MTKNVDALRMLYDKEREVFGYRVYIDSYPRPLNLLTRTPLSMHLLSLGELEAAYRSKAVMVDRSVDLKYVGHAIVGLSKYCSFKRNSCIDLADMLCKNLEYLTKYQTKNGALRCRYISPNDLESGTDGRSIAETTESFLWAIGATCKLNENYSEQVEDLADKAAKAGMWLIENERLLSPQEMGRTIYGLSLLRDTEPRKEFTLWIKRLADDLIHRLGSSKSFGLFPYDIDAIGGLSIAYLGTGSSAFLSGASRLVQHQLANQGAEGQWRWFLSRTGKCLKIFDITYSVHQLGMGPWGFFQYLATADNSRHDVYQRVARGIRWILEKRPFAQRFIVRSFSGLTGRPIQLEQRTYEAGLNLLGLLSY